MINLDELNKIAVRNQTLPINVYREYCQNLFLSFLYQQKGSEFIQFKGGTALRIFYKSPRYSEDLDFSIFKLNQKQTEDLMVAVLSNLEKANLKIDLDESKETSGGYLANLSIDLVKYKLKISVQASKRKTEYTSPNVVLADNDYVPSYTAYLLNEGEIVKEKLQAAIIRSKPRDFFDIYFLLRKGLIKRENRALLKKVSEIVGGSKINFKQELLNFLPKNLHSAVVNFKTTFLQEVEKYF